MLYGALWKGSERKQEEVDDVRSRIIDYGSIQAHTFTNTGQVPGQGPKGKDLQGCAWDKFNEESCGEHVS